MFTSLQAETGYTDSQKQPQIGQSGVCMTTPTTSAVQKPSFNNIETGLKFAPNQAIAVTGLSTAPLYHEWPRQQIPRNSSQFNFDHRASFHGRG